MHRLRGRRLWISSSGNRTQASRVGANVINARVFPVEINHLTFFLIGCFLWVQIQSSFPHPRWALLPGSLSRCPGKFAQTEKSDVPGHRILRLSFLRAPPDSIEKDSRRTIQELLFRFLRTLMPHFCGSCGRVEQERGAFITMPLEVSPAPASARDPTTVLLGESCVSSLVWPCSYYHPVCFIAAILCFVTDRRGHVHRADGNLGSVSQAQTDARFRYSENLAVK